MSQLLWDFVHQLHWNLIVPDKDSFRSIWCLFIIFPPTLQEIHSGVQVTKSERNLVSPSIWVLQNLCQPNPTQSYLATKIHRFQLFPEISANNSTPLKLVFTISVDPEGLSWKNPFGPPGSWTQHTDQKPPGMTGGFFGCFFWEHQ